MRTFVDIGDVYFRIVCIFTVQVAFAVADSVGNSRICRKICVTFFFFLQNRIFASGSAIFALRAKSSICDFGNVLFYFFVRNLKFGLYWSAFFIFEVYFLMELCFNCDGAVAVVLLIINMTVLRSGLIKRVDLPIWKFMGSSIMSTVYNVLN